MAFTATVPRLCSRQRDRSHCEVGVVSLTHATTPRRRSCAGYRANNSAWALQSHVAIKLRLQQFCTDLQVSSSGSWRICHIGSTTLQGAAASVVRACSCLVTVTGAMDESKDNSSGTTAWTLYQANAFVQPAMGFSGNPAGVCLVPSDAELPKGVSSVTSKAQQLIAAEVNCSETSFLRVCRACGGEHAAATKACQRRWHPLKATMPHPRRVKRLTLQLRYVPATAYVVPYMCPQPLTGLGCTFLLWAALSSAVVHADHRGTPVWPWDSGCSRSRVLRTEQPI